MALLNYVLIINTLGSHWIIVMYLLVNNVTVYSGHHKHMKEHLLPPFYCFPIKWMDYLEYIRIIDYLNTPIQY